MSAKHELSLDEMLNIERSELSKEDIDKLKSMHSQIVNSRGIKGWKKLRYQYRKQLKNTYKEMLIQREKDKEILPRKYQFNGN